MNAYGLTGNIGAGKSTVAELLNLSGVRVISADSLARLVVAKGTKELTEIVKTFGPGVLDNCGELDRRKVASLIFADHENLKLFQNIMLPGIRDRYQQAVERLERESVKMFVYESPLLFETGRHLEMQAIILVTARVDLRISRVRKRDSCSEQEVVARMSAQMDDHEKIQQVDYIIENNGDLGSLRKKVAKLVSDIRSR